MVDKFQKIYKAMGEKKTKTEVLPGFSKIEGGGSGKSVMWLPLLQICHVGTAPLVRVMRLMR